jgi:hypothetical protein
MAPDWAFVRTNSVGTMKINATGATSDEQELFILRKEAGGEWIDSKDRLDSINSATGETIGTYASGGEAEATKAIAIAKQAFLDTD